MVIATSYTDAENYKAKGAKNTTTITNGYESKLLLNQLKANDNEKFVFTYVGGLEDLRNPKFFWNLLEELLIENKELSQNFVLRFVGNISKNILDKRCHYDHQQHWPKEVFYQ